MRWDIPFPDYSTVKHFLEITAEFWFGYIQSRVIRVPCRGAASCVMMNAKVHYLSPSEHKHSKLGFCLKGKPFPIDSFATLIFNTPSGCFVHLNSIDLVYFDHYVVRSSVNETNFHVLPTSVQTIPHPSRT